MSAPKRVWEPLLGILICQFFISSPPQATNLPTKPPSGQELQAMFGKLPVVFEPNRGQAPPEVLFLARGEQYALFLTERGLVFSVPNLAPGCKQKSGQAATPTHSQCEPGQVRMELVGAADATITGLKDLGGRSHYYVGRDRARWITDVHHLGKVRYAGVYPGIDLVLHGSQRELEFDLVVAPGSPVSTIRLEFHGANEISLSPEGKLLVDIEGGTLTLAQPYVYQQDDAGKTAILGRYRLLAGGRVAFEIGPYDPDRTLVIDPVLTYATILGGNSRSSPLGLAVDSSGNAYMTGETNATNFPTANPVQGSNAGNTDLFVTKLSANGSILYSTYLGGSGFDTGTSIAVDAFGSAYVAGVATSTNFPTTVGAFLQTCPGQGSCNTPFVAKFQPNGMLVFSTFLGGSNTVARGIAVDGSGNAYVTGVTASDDIPVVNAFQPVFAGPISTSSTNAFVMKLNSTGSGLVYSTYLGGAGFSGGAADNRGNGIAVDSQGSAYVVGFTGSATFPVKDPLQTDSGTAFLSKFSPDGAALAYSTHLGGTTGEEASAVAVDAAGNAYVTGFTSSGDFPLLLDAFRTDCIPAGTACQSTFVLKMNAAGTGLLYSTFLGAGLPGGLVVDAGENAYITGGTASPAFPVTTAIQSTLQQASSTGNSDAFVTKLGPTGSPVFSTFFGGAGTAEFGTGIGLDASGNINLAGGVSGSNLTTTDFPILQSLTTNLPCCGFDSAFVARISAGSTPVISLAPRRAPLLTLRNVGAAIMSISSITTSPNFTLHGDCGATLAAGAFCIIGLGGNGGGSVTITSNAPGSPHTFNIDAPSFVLGASLSMSISGTFGAQLVGTTSSPQTLRLRSVGAVPAAINNILLFGDYQQTNNCPGMLAPGTFCDISVTFSPTAPNASGSIAIVHDPAATRDDFFLGGVGSTNALNSSASQVRFGTQFAGDLSLARLVTFANIGSQTLGLGTVSVTGEFTVAHNCPSSLGPAQSCRAAVSFAPTGNGSREGILSVPHGGTGAMVQMELFGFGKIHSDLAVDPLELDFFAQILNFPSNPQPVTLTNQGASPLTIAGFDLPADFSQTNDCSATLAPAAFCTVNVTFTATAIGDRSGNLLIHHDGTGSPQVILMKAEGRTQLSITPESLDFGTLPVGATSEWHFISIGNGTFNQPATLNNITINGDFALAQNPCPSELPPFFGCALQVTFTPTAAGLRTGSVLIDASDLPTPHVVPLSGMGVDSASPAFSPASFEFATQAVGTTSAPQLFTMTNAGNQALNISSITTTGPFSRTHSCPATLQPAQNCLISVTFTPNTPLLNVGSLLVQSNAFGSPHSAMLTGTGLGGLLFANPESLAFGNLLVGSTSNQLPVFFSNTGNAPLTISNISASGDFAQTNSCPAILEPNLGCLVQVTFTPTAPDLRNGTVTLTANAAGSPKVVSLQGRGLDFQVTLPPGTPSSKTVSPGQTASFNLNFVGVTGFFTDVNLTCTGAPPLGTCTINPTSVSLQGATTASAVVNVTTRAPTGTAGSVVNPPVGNPPTFASLAALLALCGFLAWMAGELQPRPLHNSWGLRATLLLALLFAACGGGGGGGGSSNPAPPSPGTPPGSYIITVTATPTFGNTHTITLTVVVQ